jgi:hypothetical protein
MSRNGISVLPLLLELLTLCGPQPIQPEGPIYRPLARDPLHSSNADVPPTVQAVCLTHERGQIILENNCEW